MAVSLALNWSPPASSPLFDDADSNGKPSTSAESPLVGDSNLTASPTNMTPTASSSGAVFANGSGSFSSQSRAGLGAPQVPRSLSTSPQPRSYASAASAKTGESPQRAGTAPPSQTPQGPFLPQGFHHLAPQLPHVGSFSRQPPYLPAQSFGGSQMPMNFPGQPQGPPIAWAQYQQQQLNAAHALQQQQIQLSQQNSPDPSGVGSDGRRRATSGPQRAPPLTYNDTLQHYPGPPFTQMRTNSLAGPGLSANGTAAQHPQPQGFHPYRRAVPRSADASASGSQSGAVSAPPSAAAIANAAQLPAPNWPRTRTASTNSSGSERSGMPSERKRNGPPPPQSYSAVAAASIRGRPPVQHANSDGPPSLTSQRRGSESSVQSSRSASRDARPIIPAAHGRADSFSSQQSAYSAYSSSDRAPASSMHSTAAASSGRTTPTPGAKKPSPLSHGIVDPVASDDEAEFGSDAGRTTPVPGGSKKKGLSGKLRKALSFSSMQELQQLDSRGQSGAGLVAKRGMGMTESTTSAGTNASTGSTQSTSPPLTPENGGTPVPYSSSGASISSRRSTRPPIAGSGDNAPKRSIFNRKFNSSTDNISISSTVSSASVMLRKMGSLGKLARRNSLMALTNVFNNNKDPSGRGGGLTDEFGGVTTGEGATSSKAAKKAAKAASKKGAPVAASVSHATVEIDPASTSQNFSANGMTPAESFVQQHQIQMRQEAEARAQREREASAASDRSQSMVEKEKERLKSKRGWRKKPAGKAVSTGLETTPADSFETDYSAAIIGSGAYNGGAGYVGGADSSSSYAAPQLDAIDVHGEFGEDLEPPRMLAAQGAEESGDEYETDSLRHWGEGIERSRASAALIRAPKGILKNYEAPTITPDGTFGRSAQPRSATSTSDPRPARLRSNSYGAPQQQAAPNAQAGMAHLSSTTEGVDRMDGIPRTLDTDADSKEARASGGGEGSDAEADPSFSTPVGSRPTSRTPSVGDTHSSPIGHHANASMPTLSLMLGQGTSTARTMPTSSTPKKRLVFAEEHIYHSTWPATVYDRRGELATCNRLTPMLAQRIKEELNTYKMEEMQVAPSSRIHTHFFV